MLQGRGIGRFMVARTVEFLKEEQIGNICLFADSEGERLPGNTTDVEQIQADITGIK